jgi:hypothetical protein
MDIIFPVALRGRKNSKNIIFSRKANAYCIPEFYFIADSL